MASAMPRNHRTERQGCGIRCRGILLPRGLKERYRRRAFAIALMQMAKDGIRTVCNPARYLRGVVRKAVETGLLVKGVGGMRGPQVDG